MPLYTFICDSCGNQRDIMVPMELIGKTRKRCARCHAAMSRLWRAPQMNTFEEYTTSDIDGVPRRITTKTQERELLKAHGLVRTGPNDMPKTKSRQPLNMPSMQETVQKITSVSVATRS
jgi:putative FmdB family regulatory protein